MAGTKAGAQKRRRAAANGKSKPEAPTPPKAPRHAPAQPSSSIVLEGTLILDPARGKGNWVVLQARTEQNDTLVLMGKLGRDIADAVAAGVTEAQFRITLS